jgi:hypothetical protein
VQAELRDNGKPAIDFRAYLTALDDLKERKSANKTVLTRFSPAVPCPLLPASGTLFPIDNHVK